MLYTFLPEVWDIFENIIRLSPMVESGFTLSMTATYLEYNEPIQVTHSEFWDCMRYFLYRINEKYNIEMQRKISARSGGK